MRKEEKTGITKERIIAAAINEFGTKGYDGSSLNTICSDSGISKGLIYHNFHNKDEIYLMCVGRCFSAFTAFLRNQELGNDLHRYMELRFRFFSEHPFFARIFFEAALQPPKELVSEIRELKKDVDALNNQIYRSVLSSLTLRDNISEADALEYFKIMQEMFNGYFSSSAYAGADFSAVVAEHEGKLRQMLDFMLYGVAKDGARR